MGEFQQPLNSAKRIRAKNQLNEIRSAFHLSRIAQLFCTIKLVIALVIANTVT